MNTEKISYKKPLLETPFQKEHLSIVMQMIGIDGLVTKLPKNTPLLNLNILQ